ncbi:SIMPL domain-containing protein [Phenylobacterium sp.]|uniref:SIMPL domain-containing protein n=1 Tax=Phenylobacterium sp. TaxID=1871053 RepID=UPI002732CD11|nr:SIMPL domain-containing protein [Phenylobacterium sp.]MDP3853109.1 SIMPL domain-containing protein [Phenylobacterium sp.]
MSRRLVILGLSLAAVAAPVTAQTPPAPAAGRYDPAPWWMDKPIMASSGYVKTEVAANRAGFGATYQVVDKDAALATKKAADKVRALGEALSAYGVDKVRVETSFSITPLYDQYRDKSGELIDNERADKIQSYQVAVELRVEVRDVRLIERVYATALAAKPSTTQAVGFSLEPDNETRTQMSKLAVEDAARRARLATEAAGSRLAGVRLIDPTGRACETDVLVAGAPRRYGDSGMLAQPVPPPAAARYNDTIEEIVTTASRRAAEVGLRPEDMQLPLQPPLQALEARACVIFALG